MLIEMDWIGLVSVVLALALGGSVRQYLRTKDKIRVGVHLWATEELPQHTHYF